MYCNAEHNPNEFKTKDNHLTDCRIKFGKHLLRRNSGTRIASAIRFSDAHSKQEVTNQLISTIMYLILDI